MGPTSHDVVARLRNTARERSVGHTGTLDPRATGLLPLVMGKATRLAPYLAGSDKTYEATICLGIETVSEDGGGQITARFNGALPDSRAVQDALATFTGTFDQIPPQVSAKRVDGKKSYDLVRQDKGVELKPVSVTVRQLDFVDYADALVRVVVTATAGFYVRALARDLGRALGTGGHLAALRRTRSGTLDIAQAVPLDEAERLGPAVEKYLITAADALAYFPAVTLNELGLKRVLHGNPVSPEHLAGRFVPTAGTGEKVRLLDESGALIALADSRGGALHPSVVIG